MKHMPSSEDDIVEILQTNKVKRDRAIKIANKLLNLGEVEYLAKGTSFVVLLLRTPEGDRRVVKIEKDDITASGAACKEAHFLRIANSIGVGPRLYSYDHDLRYLITEYFDGEFIIDFLLREKDAEKIRKTVISALMDAFRLDELGITHKELASPKRHIIVTNEGPKFIDFEKCSKSKKPKNLSQLVQFFFLNPKSPFRGKIFSIFGLKDDDVNKLVELIREYKRTEKKSEIFRRILQILGHSGPI